MLTGLGPEEPGVFYAVMWIHMEMIVYQGKGLISAAHALEPGTCFGKGMSAASALENAQRQAEWFRKNAKGKSPSFSSQSRLGARVS